MGGSFILGYTEKYCIEGECSSFSKDIKYRRDGKMIIMEASATEEQIAQIVKEVKKYGLGADVSRGTYRTVIGLVGDEVKIPFAHLATLPGVKEAMMIETPYKLINRE